MGDQIHQSTPSNVLPAKRRRSVHNNEDSQFTPKRRIKSEDIDTLDLESNACDGKYTLSSRFLLCLINA